MISNRKKSLIGILVLVFFNILTNNAYAISYPALPSSAKDYLGTSDLIVVGRIGALHKVHKFYGYQGNADKLSKLDLTSPFSLALPMVDYEVDIEEIIKNDSLFPVNENIKPLILRVIQNHDTIFNDKSTKENQGRFILFLSRNPDNETYGFYNFTHKVRLDNRNAKYLFGGQEFNVLDGTISSNDFVSIIKQEAENK